MPTRRSSLLGALALVHVCLLACVPSGATTTPEAPRHALVSAPAPAQEAEPASTPAVVNERSPVTPRLPIEDDTLIDVGSGQSVRVRPDGTVSLGDTVLEHGSPDFHVVSYQAVITRSDITLIMVHDVGSPTRRGELLHVTKIDLENERLQWRVLLSPQLDSSDNTAQWRVLSARNRLMIVEDHRVVAIDARTGTQAWVFRTFAPSFARLYLDTIIPEHRELHIDGARVRGRELVLDARVGEERDASMLELDVDSGRRIYVEGRRDAPVQTRLSDFAVPVMEAHVARDDDPPDTPPRPLHVEGYDGVAVGTTLLVWDVRSARGVIVNPKHDALGEVLAHAQGVRVAGPGGEQVPITWTAVLDTAAIADSIAQSRTKPEIARKLGPAHFDWGTVTVDSGDVVDATALARALEVPAVTAKANLPRELTVRLVREPDAYTTIVVTWGPFAFEDSSRPASAGYVVSL
jgi:hypothetical protein